jgi:hypothetical protein
MKRYEPSMAVSVCQRCRYRPAGKANAENRIGSDKAYSLNVTAIPPSSSGLPQPLGSLTMWPTGQAQPLVSTLNAPTGTVTANAAVLPAGTRGSVSVFAANDTDLLLDVNGYFAPKGSTGILLTCLSPNVLKAAIRTHETITLPPPDPNSGKSDRL